MVWYGIYNPAFPFQLPFNTITFPSTYSSIDQYNETMSLLSAPLDIDSIDEYLCQLLLPRILSVVKYFPQINWNDKKDVLLMTIQTIMMYVSIGQTPATKALGLTMQRGNTKKITILVLCSIIVPAIYRRIKLWHQRSVDSAAVMTVTSTTTVNHIGFQRKRKLAHDIIQRVEQYVPTMNLLILLSWWAQALPSHNLPRLLSGLSYTSTTLPKHLNVLYAHQRWLYEETLACVHAISPIWTWDDLTRQYNTRLQWWKPRHTTSSSNACPICQTTPITIPYMTNCQHTYCYTCLWQMKDNVKCQICRKPVTSMTRV